MDQDISSGLCVGDVDLIYFPLSSNPKPTGLICSCPLTSLSAAICRQAFSASRELGCGEEQSGDSLSVYLTVPAPMFWTP